MLGSLVKDRRYDDTKFRFESVGDAWLHRLCTEKTCRLPFSKMRHLTAFSASETFTSGTLRPRHREASPQKRKRITDEKRNSAILNKVNA